MTNKASDDLVERIAETIWLAEYLRATEKRRSIDWSEVADHDKNKYRFLANEISNGPLTLLRAKLAAAESKIVQLENWSVADKQAAEAQLASATKALEPFADCVFNDNGDMTVTYSNVEHDDFVRAYFAIRSLKPDGDGPCPHGMSSRSRCSTCNPY